MGTDHQSDKELARRAEGRLAGDTGERVTLADAAARFGVELGVDDHGHSARAALLGLLAAVAPKLARLRESKEPLPDWMLSEEEIALEGSLGVLHRAAGAFMQLVHYRMATEAEYRAFAGGLLHVLGQLELLWPQPATPEPGGGGTGESGKQVG